MVSISIAQWLLIVFKSSCSSLVFKCVDTHSGPLEKRIIENVLNLILRSQSQFDFLLQPNKYNSIALICIDFIYLGCIFFSCGFRFFLFYILRLHCFNGHNSPLWPKLAYFANFAYIISSFSNTSSVLTRFQTSPRYLPALCNQASSQMLDSTNH